MGSVSPRRGHTFTDNIHVPPVVASGLIGCDILDVTYSLIAQLFVFGEKSKKKDLYLKIPITIGSDPIKDASFGETKEVVPCYALFDYETGAVIEYVPLKVTSSVHRMMPVYRYYKPSPPPPPSLSTSSQRGQQLLVRHLSQARLTPVYVAGADGGSNWSVGTSAAAACVVPPLPLSYLDRQSLYSLHDRTAASESHCSPYSVQPLSGDSCSSPHSCTSVERLHCHDNSSSPESASPCPVTRSSQPQHQHQHQLSPWQDLIQQPPPPLEPMHRDPTAISMHEMDSHFSPAHTQSGSSKLFSYYLSEESSDIAESIW